MRRTLHGVAGGLLTIVIGLSVSTHPALAQQEQTVEGEIVDPGMYLREGRHGADLLDLTYEAVDGGQSLAVLDRDGALYLLIAEEPGEDPNELVYDYVNQLVRIKGHVYERSGMRGLVAASVEPVNPPAVSDASTP